MLKNAAAALALLFIPGISAAQGQNCYPTLELYERLKSKYGEHRILSGWSKITGELVEIWGNPVNDTWTLVYTDPEGYSCFYDVGEYFVIEDEPEPAGMRL